MTSRTGTDGHPEVAEISALTEGVLSPARTADVREHLADCELCEDVRSSLDEIRGMLGTLPGPVRMPADVAGRIDAALAAEALLDATAPETTADVSRETAPQESTARVAAPSARAAVSRETAPRATPGRPAGRPRATTGPGKQAPLAAGPRPRPGRTRRWPRALLGTACAAAVIGVGGFFLQQSGDDDPSAGSPAPGSSQSAPSTLAVGDLGAHVRDLLRSSKGAESRGMSAQSSPETTLRGSGVIAPGCVLEGIGRTEQALATRQEKYQGEDAYLVVLPHPTDASLVDAYMVAAACDTTSPSAPGKVLMNKSFSRD
ncbi:zf-HC2 domain-containing protein [Streptomyces sp. SCA3-4]|uniref:zf-HC2 domain-containing protein n=1 Tax=Streptomyces sichuanensis TaxID=2871810 RepID=UPI001CE3A48A|nr:zf-HC2 domain-containing protein [Streptomyces sichuanensis]MCA6093947.1 zf-HC2 domain-containing protein [Streptomyces sichuanensis]